MSGCAIRDAGDAAVVARLGNGIDPAINARAVALARRITLAALPGVRDVVPTFSAVTVYFDPLRTDRVGLVSLIERLDSEPEVAAQGEPAALVRVPVCYGGEFGPDLPDVARLTGFDEREVVSRHCSRDYRVFMLGFVPGFAYLGVVDPAIAVPRLPEPRRRVPAGSVAIAGPLTGIYPSETPGGWRVIGRTPLRPFLPGRAVPCVVRPGDAVRFYGVTSREFEQAWAGGTQP